MEKEVDMTKCKAVEESRHNHRGKFSEGLLNNELILNALNLQPGQKVLDAGCGNGYMSKAFSNKVTHSGKVYAVDHDKHYMNILRKETQIANLEAIECDITNPIPFENDTLDLIYISAVIHGLSKQQLQAFLNEAERILKPNGILAIVEIEKKETSFGPPLNRRFSPEELRKIVAMAPLSTIQVGEHFYLQTFRNTGEP